MEIVRSVVIDRHVEDVFRFVADPRNDPRWCATVLAVEPLDDAAPGRPGARYDVLHRPVRFRPPSHMTTTCTASEPPHRLTWREGDDDGYIDVAYELEPVWTATRLTQRNDVQLPAPRLLRPLLRRAIGRGMARQLAALKRVLEQGRP